MLVLRGYKCREEFCHDLDDKAHRFGSEFSMQYPCYLFTFETSKVSFQQSILLVQVVLHFAISKENLF